MTARDLVPLSSFAVCLLLLTACDDLRSAFREPPPPAVDQVRPYYAGHRDLLSLDMDGNVLELRVRQTSEQIERGGVIWARVGPFISLMSPATRSVFADFPGIAAVRVETVAPNGDTVARATLRRDRLSDVRWQRTLGLLGRALQDGTNSPRRLEELREWGEEHTEYEYNPNYVKR